jgi:lipoyl(octanoyl) transferase
MDLEPFQRIDPCGYPGLQVTQLSALGIDWDLTEAGRRLLGAFIRQFGYRVQRDAEVPV